MKKSFQVEETIKKYHTITVEVEEGQEDEYEELAGELAGVMCD